MPKDFICETQAELAEVCNRSIPTIALWVKSGMPYEPGRYDLRQIIPWLIRRGKHAATPAGENEDPLLAVGDSPGLERYRLAKAELAELELQVRKGTLIPIDAVKDTISRWSALIRRMGESLAKRFGNEAAELLNETLVECRRVVPKGSDDAQPANATDD